MSDSSSDLVLYERNLRLTIRTSAACYYYYDNYYYYVKRMLGTDVRFLDAIVECVRIV